jgi:hypothetical protein
MTNPPLPPRAPARIPLRWCLPGVIVIYLLVATFALIHTRGLPYGLDNNESFSSAIHARNLATYGVGRSFGLTDESYGITAAAHPFIHSHQGNFPRLFAFALYALGARSIEAQIVTTTVTVGLIAIVLAFLFFAEVVNPLLATLVCLVFISDYFLFGQWHLNTYRVWHCFFFFSSLLCLRRAVREPTPWTFALTIGNFACLCYWEYVFAFFVLTTALGYAALIGWRTPLRVVTAAGSALAGGAVAAATLGLQLTAYMGWSNVVKDVLYTLHARNSAVDSGFSAKVTAFYAQHKVLFWPNYMDAAKLRNPGTFVDSLVGQHLQFYSPWLALVMLTVGAAWFLRTAVAAVDSRVGHSRAGASGRRWLTVASVGALLLIVGWLTARRHGWYDWTQAPVWRAAGWTEGIAFMVILPLLLVVLGRMLTAAAYGLADDPAAKGVPALFSFFVAGLLAYLVTYCVFTGYVFSGYLNRQAPLLVFLSDPLLALAFYTLALPWTGGPGQSRAWFKADNPWLRRCVLAASATLVLILGVNWIRLQRQYLAIIPLDRYQFIKRLTRAPYRNASFVVNTYAAPVAYQTHSWAYFEPVFFLGGIRLTSHGFENARDSTYQWLADLDTNPAYAHPDYALIVKPTTWSDALAARLAADGGKPIQTDNDQRDGLLSRASRPFSAYLHNDLVQSDANAGPGTFAIIKLDWDYPAYLLPLPSKDSELAAETNQSRPRLAMIDAIMMPTLSPHPRAAVSAVGADGKTDPAWIGSAQSDPDWQPPPSPASASEASATSRGPEEAWMRTVTTGHDVHLDFQTDPRAGKVYLRVNDYSGTVDLDGPRGRIHPVHFDSAATSLPIVPGQYVALHRTARGLEVSYRFAQQEGRPEENTTIDLLERDRGGHWRSARTIVLEGRARFPVDLFAFRLHNPDLLHEFSRIRAAGDTRTYLQWLSDYLAANPRARTRPGLLGAPEGWVTAAAPGEPPIQHVLLRVAPDGSESLVVLVRPGTRTKQGPGYFSNYLDSAASAGSERGRSAPALTYGSVDLRVRLPIHPAGHSEPLVTTGIAMAGDLLYVIYTDADHIQIGFDHWGVGGALSPPIRIDYRQAHDFHISMGSLYPQDGNIRYQDLPPAFVDRLKGRVTVTVDGQTALSFASECYESPPAFVAIGRNSIGGSTTGPVFSGEILKVSRVFEAPAH